VAADSQGVFGFIPYGIQICLPQLDMFVFELCLIYDANLNQGWWEAASV
jgi:hypothetical protein